MPYRVSARRTGKVWRPQQLLDSLEEAEEAADRWRSLGYEVRVKLLPTSDGRTKGRSRCPDCHKPLDVCHTYGCSAVRENDQQWMDSLHKMTDERLAKEGERIHSMFAPYYRDIGRAWVAQAQSRLEQRREVDRAAARGPSHHAKKEALDMLAAVIAKADAAGVEYKKRSADDVSVGGVQFKDGSDVSVIFVLNAFPDLCVWDALTGGPGNVDEILRRNAPR